MDKNVNATCHPPIDDEKEDNEEKEEMETVVNALIETSTSRATRRVRSLAMVVKYGVSFISLAKAAIVCELFNKT